MTKVCNFIKSNFSILRLIFSFVFSLALFFMNKIVFLGKVSDENYIEDFLFSEFKILILLVPIFYIALIFIEKFYFYEKDRVFIDYEYKYKKIFIITFIVLISISYLVYYLVFFPGGMYIDSYTSLSMLTGDEEFNTSQPILYTLSMYIIKLFLPNYYLGVGIYCFIQVVFMIAVLTYTIKWLLDKKLNPVIVGIIGFVFAVFKLFPHYAISVWKDTPFSLAIFMYTLTYIDLLIDINSKSIKKSNIIKFGIFSILIIFLRNNGLYVAILSFFILVLINIKYFKNILIKNKKIIDNKDIKITESYHIYNFKAFIISQLIIILISIIIPKCYCLFGISESNFSEKVAIPIQQIARVVAIDGNITDDQKALIEKVLPIQNIKEDYRALLADPLKWDKKFDNDYLESHKLEYFKLWLELFKQNPQEYFKSYLLSTSGFWTFNVRGFEAYDSVVCFETLNDKLRTINVIDDNFNLNIRPLLEESGQYSGGFFFWITALSMYLTFKLGNKKSILIYIPTIGIWLTVMIATPMAQALRYVYCLVLMMPLNFILPFILNKKEYIEDNVTSLKTIDGKENKV